MEQRITDQQISKWMNEVILTYVSFAGGRYIVADNALARDACEYMFDYDERGNIPERYFEIARNVGNEYERRRNRR